MILLIVGIMLTNGIAVSAQLGQQASETTSQYRDAVADNSEDKCTQKSNNLIDFISRHPEMYYSGSPYWKALSKMTSQEKEQFMSESESLSILKPSKDGPCKIGGSAYFAGGDKCICPYSSNLCEKCNDGDYTVENKGSIECILGKWYAVKSIVVSNEKVPDSRRTFLQKLFGWNIEEDKFVGDIESEFVDANGNEFPCTVSFIVGKPTCNKQLEKREDGNYQFK